MNSRNLQGGDRMRRQLAQQHKQQEQQQQQTGRLRRAGGGELPARQDQTRHNPVAEGQQRGSFTSDQ